MATQTLVDAPVSFTANALAAVRRIQEEESVPADHVLRVGVKGGGCSGMSYVLAFDETTDSDKHFELDGVHMVMDKRHELYLLGMTIDFQDGLNARGFMFNNPNASESCGCGISFSA